MHFSPLQVHHLHLLSTITEQPVLAAEIACCRWPGQAIATLSLQKGLSWTRLFTDRLSEDVKMVGPAISCTTPSDSGDEQSAEGMPHLAPYAVATDAVRQYRLCALIAGCTAAPQLALMSGLMTRACPSSQR